MNQKQMEEVLQKDSKQELRDEFNKLKKNEVEKATTKVVNFFVHIGCGCGGSYEKFHAEVPINKRIEEGESFNDFKPWMSNVEEGWV